MENHKDAFGQVLYDYWKNKTGCAIIERDDGLFELDHLIDYYFADYKSWWDHEKKAIRFAKGKVLDIGCGAGRVALHLQNKGLDVVGIDNSPLILKVCRQRGFKKVKLMSITELSQKLGIFDTIILYGNNFGLLGSYKKAKWLLRRFAKMTSKNGQIIVSTIDPYDTKEANYLDYHQRNRSKGRMCGQLRIRTRYKKYVTDWLDYLLVSRDEMRKILKGTGWKVKRFIEPKRAFYAAVIEKENYIGAKK